MFKNKKLAIALGVLVAGLAVIAGLTFSRNSTPKNEESKNKVQSTYKAEPRNLGNDKINVAYSTDENYVYPTLVSMTSLMENANKDTKCAFTVLLSDGVSDEQKSQFMTVQKNYKNCSVNLVDMGGQFGSSEVRFWSRAMYYRLALHEILKDEKRCIYIDGDTIVRKDLTEMYSTNMDGYYIAGIRDFNYYINKDSDHNKLIGIPDLNTYVCSGVLIMNLEKIRNDGLGDVFDKLIKENDEKKIFKFPDQDALNKACYGHILTLPFKYGALAHTGFEKSYTESKYAQWASNEKDWDEGRKDPTIVHFTGDGETGGKPWRKINSSFCEEWWKYVEKTDFKDQITNEYKSVQKV